MKKFRIAVKNIALTYPKCDLTKEEVLDKLQWKFRENLESYVVSQEKHESGANHIHAYISLHKLVNIIDPHYLDVGGCHGNYQSARSKKNWVEYIVKDGNYITNLNIREGKILNMYDKLVWMVRDNQLELALGELEKKVEAREILGSYTKYKNNLIALNESINPKKHKSKYNIEDYDIPQSIQDWRADKKNRTLVLEGPSGYGKTQGTLALLGDLNPRLIREINDLKKLTPANRAAIYDDLDVSNLAPDTLKHLFDGEVDGVIRVLYSSVTIDASIKKVLIVNTFKLDTSMGKPDLDAIHSRLKHIRLDKSLIKKVVVRERIDRETEIEYDTSHPGGLK